MNRFLKTALIIFLCVCLLCITVSAFSKIGSVGTEVTAIQEKLKNLGFYSGSIDGIYGSATRKAVQRFQSANGLSADGIAGEKTLAALGIKDKNNVSGYTTADVSLLARIISAEARGESYLGQVAVGAVILNRVVHPSFPDTLAGVIYQNGAFSCVSDGQFYESVADSAYKAAYAALDGIDPSGGAIYYYNPKTATNKWIRSRKVIATIGNHVFCE